jgi:hypothetical protein
VHLHVHPIDSRFRNAVYAAGVGFFDPDFQMDLNDLIAIPVGFIGISIAVHLPDVGVVDEDIGDSLLHESDELAKAIGMSLLELGGIELVG